MLKAVNRTQANTLQTVARAQGLCALFGRGLVSLDHRCETVSRGRCRGTPHVFCAAAWNQKVGNL